MERDEQNRRDELLMQRVTGALSLPEAESLAQSPDADVSMAEWDAAAAELAAVMALETQTSADLLPAHLADRIAGVGEALVRANASANASVRRIESATSVRSVPSSPLRAVAVWGGWFAAAAALVLYVASPRAARAPDSSTSPTAVAPSPNGVLSRGAVLRDSLLGADSALVRLAWTATADSSAHGATGDVVWSATAQRGVMRIAGLQPNDRKRWQYQLWIFDKKRDERYPVDGGVFDIPPGAHEVFVPIDARVPVGEAVLFAITVEAPGGVVVSKRDRIALVAKPAG